MKHLLFSLFCIVASTQLSAQAESLSHTHNGRLHSHGLPSSGINHRHGVGGMGVSATNQQPKTNHQPIGNGSCNQGNAKACFQDGIKALGENNTKSALIYLSKACYDNHITACGAKGYVLSKKNKFEESVTPYKKACFSNAKKPTIASSCSGLGDSYIQISYKNKKQKDHFKSLALKSYKRSCETNDSEGFYKAACSSYSFITRGYTQEERKQAEAACNNKSEKSCVRLADIYMTGRGVSKDIEKGYSYTDKACDAGKKSMCGMYQAYLSSPSTVDRHGLHHCQYVDCIDVFIKYSYPSDIYEQRCAHKTKFVYAASAYEASQECH